MFDKIIQFSLHNRVFIIAGAILVLVYGSIVLVNLPVDVLPDLNRPTVTIMTEAEGMAPDEIEPLVSQPIEVSMNGAPGVERVRSVSGVGLSIVYVEFAWNTDIYLNRQLVNERLQSISGRLPKNITPSLAPVSSVMGQIMMIGLSSDTTSPMNLRTIADYTIRQRLLTIPGVAQVINIGGGVKQYQILVNNTRMRSYGISAEEVEKALRGISSNTTGGYIEKNGEEYLVRNIASTISPDDFGNTVIKSLPGGSPVLIKNVARVTFGVQTRRGDASINGKPSVILSVEKQPGANTLQLTEEVDKALSELKTSLPSDVKLDPNIFRQSYFILSAIRNVVEALRDGAILVIIILFLFLLNFRTTIITLTAIPLSLVITAVVFQLLGVSINTMTLGGLAVAIGELVDDAVVDVENVFRRLRENKLKLTPLPSLVVVYHASKEVRNSIVYATVLVVLVFIPLFALGGIEGKIFAPLGLAYITSIIASLFVSLTVTPALASYLLPKAKIMQEEKEGFLVRWLKSKDEKLLHFTLDKPKKILSAVALLFVTTVVIVPFFGSEFLPPFNEGSLTINFLASPGTSLQESNRIGTLAEKALITIPEVKTVSRRTGRAELDEHAEGTHSSEIDVDLRASDRSKEEVLHDIRDKLSVFPVVVNIGQPISHRLDHLLSGVRAQIAIKLFGNNLSELRSKAEEIQKVISSVPGAVDVSVEKQTLIPQIPIRINREAAARYGITPGQITEYLETTLNGKVVGNVLSGQVTSAILLRFDSTDRSSIEDISSLMIPGANNNMIPLRSLAEVEVGRGANIINHENGQRRIVIQANISERSLGDVVADMQQKVQAEVKLPEGFFLVFGGQFESQQSAVKLIGILSIFSLALMFLVLYSHFRSTQIALQVLLNIPLALIGSVIAILITNRTISVASLVGFITLTGIASRNGIMMISHYIHLVKEEGETFSQHMIIRGSLERLIPVMMTALTAGLALIPLVLASGETGKEILYPVAVVILGGLVSSTLLDIFVTPVVFYAFGRNALEKYLERDKQKDVFSKATTLPTNP